MDKERSTYCENSRYSGLERFLEGLLYEGKVFLWVYACLNLFRLLFLAVFASEVANTVPVREWLESLWFGLRLSLKTTGLVAAVSVLVATVPYTLWKQWPHQGIRHRWIAFVTGLFTVLFMIRIPYFATYKAFFNQMVLHGGTDDVGAILSTIITQYGVWWRLPLMALFAYVLIRLGLWWMRRPVKTVAITKRSHMVAIVIGLLVGLPIFGVWIRFGGAFNYSNSIQWESIARVSSHTLNENILDDGQAMYRVYTMYRRQVGAGKIDYTADDVRSYIRQVGGNGDAPTIDEAFRTTVTGAPLLAQQPSTVIFVLGESYPMWPFMKGYEGLGEYIVQEGMDFANAPSAFHTKALLPFGQITSHAVNGFVTGLPEINVSPNYETLTYQMSYSMGMGNTMKRFGYKTVFWYAGFGSWQSVEALAKAQGFDECYDATTFNTKEGNAWGAPDRILFDRMNTYMEQHPNDKVFHFVLTISNHAPYDVDVKKEGFEPSKVKHSDVPSVNDSELSMTELGHIWYADKVMGQFLRKVEANHKDALFVITGDHSERFDFATEVPQQVRTAVPAIFYGAGLEGRHWSVVDYGSALQIAPTLYALVARTGDYYDSVAPPLFSPQPVVGNRVLYTDERGMHPVKELHQQGQDYLEALRRITLWRVKRGNELAP